MRCYNPPRFDSPFGWLSRDHRKMLAVDGRVGFVTGLCVGRMWVGDPEKKIEPWRDTGVEVRGPAVADIERAFAQVWAMMGEPIPEQELISRDALARGRRYELARRGERAGDGRDVPRRSTRRRACEGALVADGCLLRRNDRLRAGLARGGKGRR